MPNPSFSAVRTARVQVRQHRTMLRPQATLPTAPKAGNGLRSSGPISNIAACWRGHSRNAHCPSCSGSEGGRGSPGISLSRSENQPSRVTTYASRRDTIPTVPPALPQGHHAFPPSSQNVPAMSPSGPGPQDATVREGSWVSGFSDASPPRPSPL